MSDLKEHKVKVGGYVIAERHIHVLAMVFAVMMSFASYDNWIGKLYVSIPQFVFYGFGVWYVYMLALFVKSIQRNKPR